MKTTDSTPVTTGRLRRRLVVTLLALTVFGGTMLGTARPAHAATTVFGCFVTASGYQRLPAGTPVYLLVYRNGAWWNTNYYLPMDQWGCVQMPTHLWANDWKALSVNTGGAYGTSTFGGTFYGSTQPVEPGDSWASAGLGFLYYSCVGRVSVCY